MLFIFIFSHSYSSKAVKSNPKLSVSQIPLFYGQAQSLYNNINLIKIAVL